MLEASEAFEREVVEELGWGEGGESRGSSISSVGRSFSMNSTTAEPLRAPPIGGLEGPERPDPGGPPGDDLPGGLPGDSEIFRRIRGGSVGRGESVGRAGSVGRGGSIERLRDATAAFQRGVALTRESTPNSGNGSGGSVEFRGAFGPRVVAPSERGKSYWDHWKLAGWRPGWDKPSPELEAVRLGKRLGMREPKANSKAKIDGSEHPSTTGTAL